MVKLCENGKSSRIACGDGLRVQERESYNDEKGVVAPNTTGRVAMVRTDFIFSTELSVFLPTNGI